MINKRTVLSMILAIIMIFTMVLAVFADSAEIYSDYYLKVGLAYGSSAPSVADISASGNLKLSAIYDNEHDFDTSAVSDIEAYSSVKLVNAGDHIDVYDAAAYGTQVLNPETGEMEDALPVIELTGNGKEFISAGTYFDDEARIRYQGSEYRGGIIPLLKDGKMTIINYIKADDYIRGVLHAEIGQSSPAETLKAQAVTARSFTYINKTKYFFCKVK